MIKQFVLADRYRSLLRRLRDSFEARRWAWVIGLVAFAVVNGYIAYRLYQEWDAIAAFDWRRVEPGYLAAAAGIQFVGLLLVVGTWSYMLRQYGYQIPYRRHFKIYTLANLARKLPAGMGFDILSRVYMYGQEGGGKVQVTFASLIELPIFGVAATIVLLITMSLPGSIAGAINPLIPICVLVAFLVLIPSPPFRSLLGRISQVPPEQQQLRWHHLFSWATLNALTIGLGGVTLFLFCRAFGVVGDTALLPLIQYWSLVIVSSVLLVWLPVDIGAVNGVTVLALATLMPMPQAIVLLIAWRVWTTITEMVWGAIGFVI